MSENDEKNNRKKFTTLNEEAHNMLRFAKMMLPIAVTVSSMLNAENPKERVQEMIEAFSPPFPHYCNPDDGNPMFLVYSDTGELDDAASIEKGNNWLNNVRRIVQEINVQPLLIPN
jgi:hypothetical protein